MANLEGPFRANEAVRAGYISRGLLAGPTTTRLYPNVHAPASRVAASDDTLGRAREAVLYVRGAAPLIGGFTAAELHGASCGPESAPVELIVGARRVRGRPGLMIRQDVVAEGDVVVVDGLRTTSPERTAWDLVRRLDTVEAVVALDALARIGRFAPADLLERPTDVRGGLRVAGAVAMSDPRSGSPPETRVRLLLGECEVPPPVPQLVVLDAAGVFVARVDLGWEEVKVAVEYQGDQHRSDRARWRRDQARLAALAAVGWVVLPCTAGDLYWPGAFLARVRSAIAHRTRPFP